MSKLISPRDLKQLLQLRDDIKITYLRLRIAYIKEKKYKEENRINDFEIEVYDMITSFINVMQNNYLDFCAKYEWGVQDFCECGNVKKGNVKPKGFTRYE